MELPERIVFFDGVCGLCNRFVDRLLTDDARGMLRFAPLQGATAAQRLPISAIQTVKGGWRKTAPPRGPELVATPSTLEVPL